MSIHGRDSLDGQLVPVHTSDNKLEITNFVWDTDTLSWVRQSQYSSGGPTSNVNVIGTVGLTDGQLRASPISTTSEDYAQRVDDLDTTIYIGKAALGVINSSALWQIKRIVFSGTVATTQWANGNANYTNTWDARASYTYT
jgi:hypothetical protein